MSASSCWCNQHEVWFSLFSLYLSQFTVCSKGTPPVKSWAVFAVSCCLFHKWKSNFLYKYGSGVKLHVTHIDIEVYDFLLVNSTMNKLSRSLVVCMSWPQPVAHQCILDETRDVNRSLCWYSLPTISPDYWQKTSCNPFCVHTLDSFSWEDATVKTGST